MFGAVVFNTINALEFHEVRKNVIRIPEVISRARAAQQIWDSVCDIEFDFTNFIASDDASFLGNLRLKNLATAVVQMGLLDRFLRFHPMPELIAGLTNGDAALRVVLGQITFDELVQNSPALGKVKLQLMKPTSIAQLPILSGISLAEFGLFVKGQDGFVSLHEKEMDFRQILKQVVNNGAKKIVVIGPGAGHPQSCLRDFASQGVEVVDSLSLDPNLQWFWQEQTVITQPSA